MKTVSLVLGSGGARGLAQIGVIQELEARNYEISEIAGASMGAVIGGIYASGHLPEFTKWITNLDKYGVYNLMDFTLSVQGFIKGDRVFNEIKKFVTASQIEDLNIPFRAVAVDIVKNEQHIFSSGDLFTAIRASVAIPSVLTPVYLGGSIFIDGGVMNPLPLNLIEKREGKRIVAVDLNCQQLSYQPIRHQKDARQKEIEQEQSRWKSKLGKVWADFFASNKDEKTKRHNYYDILNLSFDLMTSQLTSNMLAVHQPEVLVSIARNSGSTFDFFRGQELIDYGRSQACVALDDWELRQENAAHLTGV